MLCICIYSCLYKIEWGSGLTFDHSIIIFVIFIFFSQRITSREKCTAYRIRNQGTVFKIKRVISKSAYFIRAGSSIKNMWWVICSQCNFLLTQTLSISLHVTWQSMLDNLHFFLQVLNLMSTSNIWISASLNHQEGIQAASLCSDQPLHLLSMIKAFSVHRRYLRLKLFSEYGEKSRKRLPKYSAIAEPILVTGFVRLQLSHIITIAGPYLNSKYSLGCLQKSSVAAL